MTIDGKGKTIDGNGQARIFYIASGADVTIKNLNLINGNAAEGGAIYVDGGTCKIENTSFSRNSPANFIIQDNVISLNQADGFITVGNFTIITDDGEFQEVKIYQIIQFLQIAKM